jgi:hypothetical protein
MNIATLPKEALARAGILLALFVASILLTFAVVLGLRTAGIVPDPENLIAQKTLGEFIIRLILLLFLGSSYVAILWNAPVRGWFLEQRWRLLILVLFALGSVSAMADPFHPIRGEMNWIRYWTAGPLAFAGVLSLINAMRNVHPIPDRLFGAAFGSLLIAASADEIFEFHERAADFLATDLRLNSSVFANDLSTLVVAILGVVALCTAILVRRFGGRLGQLLQQPRYRLPMRLFAFSVVTFAVAMMLDTFDVYLQSGVDFLRGALISGAGDMPDRLWLALTDVRALANSIEELLEFLAALTLLMMIGNLFSIKALGDGTDTV